MDCPATTDGGGGGGGASTSAGRDDACGGLTPPAHSICRDPGIQLLLQIRLLQGAGSVRFGPQRLNY